MNKVSDVVRAIDGFAPFRSAYAGDPVGLQIGSSSANVAKAVVSLDRSEAAIWRCIEIGAELLVCHHPLIYRPMSRITDASLDGKAALELISHGIAFIAAHTNWDCASGGVNDTLAALLGLSNIQAFGDSGPSNESKLVVFSPFDSADKIVDALSEAGAGQIGEYSRCAFLSDGTGTFIPGDGANPRIGARGKQENVQELRIEMIVPNDLISRAIKALRSVHPYEEPAFDLYELCDRKPWPIARIGELAEPMALSAFVQMADARLLSRSWVWGDPRAKVARAAVCGGSGADLWRSALSAGADVLLTGECPQHVALEAADSGFAIIASGHYATENPGAKALKDKLAETMPDIEWEFFEPNQGLGGKPFYV